jgi:hypothetical protein
MAETFSRALCREYRNRFGAILHHNVDKRCCAAVARRRPSAAGRSLPRSMSISPVEPFRRLQTTIFRLRRSRLKAQGRG